MTSPHDPCGRIYSILPEEWIGILWFFEPVFIPQVFREHLVLVLGWTTGRRGYVSIAMVSTASLRYPGHILTVNRLHPTSLTTPTQTTTCESGLHAVGQLPARAQSRCERTKLFPFLSNIHTSGSTGCGRCRLPSFKMCPEWDCS